MSVISNIPVALQMWSLNPVTDDYPTQLKKVAELGYEGVEFAGFHDIPAAELKKMLADLGLGIAGSHTAYALLIDKFEETIDYNLELGNKRIIVPAIGEEVRETTETWQAFADDMCKLHEKVKAKGLEFGYHNHAFEFDKKNGANGFDVMFSTTPQDFIMQVDMGWSFRAGADARDLFKKYPGRSTTVHVKAFSAAKDKACIGEDDVPWAEVLPVAVETGKAEWFIVEHERHEGDAYTNVKTCLDFLHSLR